MVNMYDLDQNKDEIKKSYVVAEVHNRDTTLDREAGSELRAEG